MVHISANFTGSGHTISNLCKHVSRVFKEDKYQLIDSKWVTRFRIEPDISLVPRFDLPPNSVVHLGNNFESLPLLMAVRESKYPCVIIAHDAWLFDLMSALALTQERANSIISQFWADTGASGPRFLMHRRRRAIIDSATRDAMFGHVMNLLFDKEKSIIIHRADLNIPGCSYAPLPYAYHDFLENPSFSVNKRYDVIVSGHYSAMKNTDMMAEAISLLLRSTELKFAIGGSIAAAFQDPNIQSRNLNLFSDLNDKQWQELHQSARLGIRLGIGLNGECSGSLRDYLALGLRAISDDPGDSIAKSCALSVVSNQITSHELAAVIRNTVVKPVVRYPYTQEERTETLINYASAIREYVL